LLKYSLEVCMKSILLLVLTLVWVLFPFSLYHKELDFLSLHLSPLIPGSHDADVCPSSPLS
jgi:hypothetical protein